MSARIVADSSRRVRRTTAATSGLDVGGVGLGDRREHLVVCEQRRETAEEVADLRVSTACEAGEAVARCRDGGVDDGVFRCGDVEEVAGVLHDDQSIAGREAFREIGADVRHPVTAEHDRLS